MSHLATAEVKQDTEEDADRIMTAALGLSALASGMTTPTGPPPPAKVLVISPIDTRLGAEMEEVYPKGRIDKVKGSMSKRRKESETACSQDGEQLSPHCTNSMSSSGYSSRSESSDLDSPVPERTRCRSSLPPKKRRAARQRTGSGEGEPQSKVRAVASHPSSAPSPGLPGVFTFPHTVQGHTKDKIHSGKHLFHPSQHCPFTNHEMSGWIFLHSLVFSCYIYHDYR